MTSLAGGRQDFLVPSQLFGRLCATVPEPVPWYSGTSGTQQVCVRRNGTQPNPLYRCISLSGRAVYTDCSFATRSTLWSMSSSSK